MMGIKNEYYDIIVPDEQPVDEVLEEFDENFEDLEPVDTDYDIEQTDYLETRVEYIKEHLKPKYTNG